VSALEALGSRAHKTLRAFPRETFFSPGHYAFTIFWRYKKQKKTSLGKCAKTPRRDLP
jgi:hypothetical protein